jgi:hypothetical protein
MNSKYMVMVAAMAVMLIGATALATDNAFADGKKKYGKNQATSQVNACGNGKLPMYVFCENTGSQVQGEDNSVAISSNQGEQERDGHHGGGNGDGHHGGGNGDGHHGGGNGDGDYEEDW